MRMLMRCFGVLACLALVVSACSDYTVDLNEWKAPVLSKDWKTVVDLRSNVDFGEQVAEAFSTDKALTGFVFDAHQGARVTVTLDATNGDDPVLLLYGPLDDKGIWGGDGKHIALDHDSKDGRNSLISDFALAKDGRYLIGADTRDGSVGGPLQLTMGCRGECDEPRCDDDTLLCDLYCPGGFMTDPTGCPICRCVEECQTDEDCLLPWSDQIARCIDGQCVYDELACDDNTQCPSGFVCEIVCVGGGTNCDPDDASCRPDDTCDPSTGECHVECFGRCVPRPDPDCQSDADCPPGYVCLMECWVPGCDPTTGDCPPGCDPATGECPSDCDPATGECPPYCKGRCVPEAIGCQSDDDCPPGFVCEMACWDCAPDGTDCRPGCEGYCVPEPLPECDENHPCPPGYECVMECWPGDCDPTTGECPENCDATTGECGPICVGHCVPIPEPECRTDEDCRTPGNVNGVCIDGRCVFDIDCSLDGAICPPGTECVIICGGPDGDPTGECRGYCLPHQEPECFTDDDCLAAGAIGKCINGRCVFDDLDCSLDGSLCPPGTECVIICGGPDGDPTGECRGYCVPIEPECLTDEDCRTPDGENGVCIDGRCVFDQIFCDENRPCPPGYVCEILCPDNGMPCYGVCVPDQAQCRVDTDCIDEAGNVGRCVEGRCVFGPMYCRADWECPPGYECQFIECLPDDQSCPSGDPNCCIGICVPVDECRVDEDCILPGSDGTVIHGRCIDGRCVYDDCNCYEIYAPVCAEKCYTDPLCDGGPAGDCPEFCELITYPNDCYAECDGARILYAGTCEDDPIRCGTDADCPPGMICEFDSSDPAGGGICVPLPNMECRDDADCPEGFRCELGPCPGNPCDPDGTCPCDPDGTCPPCWGQCVPVQSECIVTGCSGEVCAPFPVDTPCVWLPEYECLRFAMCEPLPTEAGVACGWVHTEEYLECMRQFEDPDECVTDADCPPGMICQTFCGNGWCESRCYPMDCVCPDDSDPVCGTDGTVYDNICFANCAGVDAAPCGDDDTRP